MNRREFLITTGALLAAPRVGRLIDVRPLDPAALEPPQFAEFWRLMNPRSTLEALAAVALFRPHAGVHGILEAYLGDPPDDALRCALFPETRGEPLFADQIERAVEVLGALSRCESAGWVAALRNNSVRTGAVEEALMTCGVLPRGAAQYAAYLVTHFARVAVVPLAAARACLRRMAGGSGRRYVPGWFEHCQLGEAGTYAAEVLEIARRRRVRRPSCGSGELLPTSHIRVLLQGRPWSPSRLRPCFPEPASTCRDGAELLRPSFPGQTILIVAGPSIDESSLVVTVAERYGVGLRIIDGCFTGEEEGIPALSPGETMGRMRDFARFQGVSERLLWPGRANTRLLLRLAERYADRVVDVDVEASGALTWSLRKGTPQLA